jgi:hypothetical protein
MSGLISRVKRMRLRDVLRRNPLFYDEAMRPAVKQSLAALRAQPLTA